MRPLLLIALAACTSQPSDITGPYTGPVHRFVVDRFTLAQHTSEAKQLGDDLDGDGTVDNALGQVTGTLASYMDLTTHAPDMIASGAIASTLELQAADLVNARVVGATYYGATGDPATVAGGSITAGSFESNRTVTTHVPGMAMLHLPVFADADPSLVELDAMELDLEPDGQGGYNGVMRGGVPQVSLDAAVCLGIQQMVLGHPDDHLVLASILDHDRDGQLTCDEIVGSTFIGDLLVPDLKLFGEPVVTLGFGFHVKPCDSGGCTSAPADECHDRVRDGDETGVDCGGSCGACPVANPTCSDGVRDGLETDVDCGWNCGGCALGKHCFNSSDCAAPATCSQPAGTGLGTCITAP